MNLELSGRRALISLFVSFLVGLGLGLLFLHLARSGNNSNTPLTNYNFIKDLSFVPYEQIPKNEKLRSKELRKKIIDRMDKDEIRKNLRYLTERPHLAGTKRDEELALSIKDRFIKAGFDYAEMVSYNVLLSRPNTTDPNKISLWSGDSKIFESRHMEEPIHPDDSDPEFIHAFNSFTPAGTVRTEPGVGVVYVNYGRIEDFKRLAELGVSVSGRVAMVRYGKIYRGNKVKHAQEHGALGLIIFSDPEDVAPEGTEPKDVYDNTMWLPGTGIQRGNTYLGQGDVLTPGWPSTEHAYRLSMEEADIPKIPTQPIGYSDARQILEKLDGDFAPEDWQGGMTGLKYKLGPFFKSEYKDVSLSLSTHNYLEISKNYNVLGVIKGAIEPDRYVILGNHRDAWGYGSMDPSSGTAQILETSRVLGTLLQEGWRPRRTILICSWGAEEYGLIGSTEWVEEHIDKLKLRTVAYINTDTCVTGPILHVQSSPLMWDITVDLSKLIPGPMDPSKSLYDEWRAYNLIRYPEALDHPIYKSLGSGSDHAGFSFFAGIPSVDYVFLLDKNKFNISIYPSYHTGYETFNMVSSFVDPEFNIIQSCGRLSSLLLTRFSESFLLPYNLERFPREMMRILKEFKHRETLLSIYDKYLELENSIERLSDASKTFNSHLEVIENGKIINPFVLRGINDQLMKFEQIFIMPAGLPRRAGTGVRHAIFAPSVFDKYSSSGFPGLSDLMYDYAELVGDAKKKREEDIRRHISDLMIMTDRATSFLKDLHFV